MASLAPSWRPKRLQNWSQTLKKSMLKSVTFSTSILEGFGCRFGGVFGKVFGTKMHANCKSVLLAKTWKILLPSRRNANFQEIEDPEKWKNRSRTLKNLSFCCTSILNAFWEVFGRVSGGRNRNFHIFFDKKWKQNLKWLWNAKKRRTECLPGGGVLDLTLHQGSGPGRRGDPS